MGTNSGDDTTYKETLEEACSIVHLQKLLTKANERYIPKERLDDYIEAMKEFQRAKRRLSRKSIELRDDFDLLDNEGVDLATGRIIFLEEPVEATNLSTNP